MEQLLEMSFIYTLASRVSVKNDKWLVVLDNASIHRKEEYFKDAKQIINFLFLPPYTPILNPIEIHFSILKQKIKKNIYTNIDDIILEIHYTLTPLNPAILKNLQSKLLKEILTFIDL